MIGVSESPTLRLAGWAAKFEPEIISGSVYAVQPPERLEAAKMLDHAGYRVHVDLIVSADGIHVGVSPDELLLIRDALPDARLDVHLILPKTGLFGSVRETAEAAIRTAKDAKAETLVVSPEALHSFSDVLTEHSDHPVEIWAEVAVGSDATNVSGVDGALVMLIESGTKNSADRTHLNKVPALATAGKVGIDGGVTASVAAEAWEAGATVIVSGRALFEPIQERKATHVD
ncbi:MAG: ribulose-phosphate 3-epimerase [Pseudarthrobacter sp.]|jgi:pentose-5-phosphate-3-epimerase|nr:ribulose-phosphate 3-epimerase [Pseudarthrobacter sp.]